jgi:peptidoglycan/LPS O-acetylase OafA/YrhL
LKKNKIFALESLRGLAAVFVALYHYPSTSFLHFKNGSLGVAYFFVLSGFVITLNYIDKINSLKDLLNFQIKRFYRLYPTHIFILFIVLIVQILKYFLINYTNIKSGQSAFGDWYSLKDFIANLFLIQAVFSNFYYLSWNGAAWSISTEFYTYIIFAILFMLINKRFIPVIILIYLLSKNLNFLNLYYFKNFFNIFNSVFFICIFYFSIGCLTYYLYSYLYKKVLINNYFSICLCVIFILIKLFFESFFISYDFLIFLLLILIVTLLEKKTYLYKLLNSKILIFLGTISYSFYLIHQTIIYFVVQIFRFVLKVEFIIDEKSGSVSGTANVHIDTAIHLIYVGLSIFFAYLINKYVENKFRRQ